MPYSHTYCSYQQPAKASLLKSKNEGGLSSYFSLCNLLKGSVMGLCDIYSSLFCKWRFRYHLLENCGERQERAKHSDLAAKPSSSLRKGCGTRYVRGFFGCGVESWTKKIRLCSAEVSGLLYADAGLISSHLVRLLVWHTSTSLVTSLALSCKATHQRITRDSTNFASNLQPRS